MIVQILVASVCLFLLLLGLTLFYIRHQSKVPYYRLTQKQCVVLLSKSAQGVLPEREWHIFIGMSIRDNDALETLREQCLLIDEACVKGSCLVNGQYCVSFTKQGIHQLEVLLDEWQHKSDYLV